MESKIKRYMLFKNNIIDFYAYEKLRSNTNASFYLIGKNFIKLNNNERVNKGEVIYQSQHFIDVLNKLKKNRIVFKDKYGDTYEMRLPLTSNQLNFFEQIFIHFEDRKIMFKKIKNEDYGYGIYWTQVNFF